MGVDHAGALRSWDFLPVVPGTGKGGFRPEAKTWPGGGIQAYLDALSDTLLPALRSQFHVSEDPERVTFGGSSFGGICVLHAIVSGHRLASAFGKALVESPSLWIDEGRYLDQVLIPAARDPKTHWPGRMFLGMGAKEHSGTRGGNNAGPAVTGPDAIHVEGANRLAEALQGLGEDRLQFVLDPHGAHNEGDWARRLPGALRFLLAEPDSSDLPPPPVVLRRRMAGLAAARTAAAAAPDHRAASANAGSLFFTSPRDLVSGAPFTLYFNRRLCSVGLGNRPNVKLHYGFNGWTMGNEQYPVALAPSGLHIGHDADWWVCRVQKPIPEGATEMNFVFSDGEGLYNNANGSDFSVPVIEPEESAAAALEDSEALPLREIAKTASALSFVLPSRVRLSPLIRSPFPIRTGDSLAGGGHAAHHHAGSSQGRPADGCRGPGRPLAGGEDPSRLDPGGLLQGGGAARRVPRAVHVGCPEPVRGLAGPPGGLLEGGRDGGAPDRFGTGRGLGGSPAPRCPTACSRGHRGRLMRAPLAN